MTVSYSLNVSKATFGGFAKLLFRWKGSIFKNLWRESLLFCCLYVSINTSYRHALSQQQQTAFAEVVKFAKYFMDVIPFYFIVGFYVTTVTGRFMSQFNDMPWPDRVILTISSFVHGSDDRSRMIRRTLARYVILHQILTYQTVSTAVRKRFPTTQHLVAAGIMTAEERSVYEKVNFPFGKWWLPCHWFTSLATRARKEDRIKDSLLLKGLFEEMFSFRNSCAAMIGYDWVSVPLAYTQVATIATYLYAIVLLVGTQSIETPTHLVGFTADYYFPFVTIWRFFFSVGWLKVAEQLLNPYGEDDDDFELNWSFDRALRLAYDVVDTHHMMHPKVRKDAFWEKDIRLPQTELSAKYMKNPEIGSAVGLEIEEADYLPIDELCEKDEVGNLYKNQSIKKTAANRQNSSFIRRVFNAGFAQSIRKARKHPPVGRSFSCKQGISNTAFYMGDESYASTHGTPLTSRKSCQSNLAKKASPTSKRSSMKLKPRSPAKQKINRMEEIEMADEGDIAATTGGAKIFKEKKINGNIPPSSTATIETEPTGRNESRNDIEDNDEEQDLDDVMPSIPEESSRANSLASIELIPAPSQKDKTPNHPQDLVAEVSEKLLGYPETASAQERCKKKESKDYMSCCSSDSSDDVSEGSSDELEDVAAKQKDETVCVTIEQEQKLADGKCANQNGEP